MIRELKAVTHDNAVDCMIPMQPGLLRFSTIEIKCVAVDVTNLANRYARSLFYTCWGQTGEFSIQKPYYDRLVQAGDGFNWTVDLMTTDAGLVVRLTTGSEIEVHWTILAKVGSTPSET